MVLTALLGAISGAIALAAAMIYLAFQPDAERAARWWAVAFILNVARYFCGLPDLPIPPNLAWSIAEALQALTALLLLGGTLHFLGRRIGRTPMAVGMGLIALWAGYGAVAGPAFLVLTIPFYTFSGFAYIFTGWSFHKSSKIVSGAAYDIAGAIFVLSGLHKLDYPFLRPHPATAYWGFMLAQVLTSLLAISLVIVALSRQRQRAQDAKRQAMASERKAADAQARLTTAVEALDQGFAYFDAEDRLVQCNSVYRDIFTEVRTLVVPGVPFHTLVRAAAEKRLYRGVPDQIETAIALRLARHRHGATPFDQPLANGHIYSISERPTADGGIVGIWTDVTQARLHERALAHLVGASGGPEATLRAAAEALSIALDYRFAAVIERAEESDQVRVLAYYDRERPGGWDDMPSDESLATCSLRALTDAADYRLIPGGVADHAPDCPLLSRLGAQSFQGMAFTDGHGRRIGHIVALDARRDSGLIDGRDFFDLIARWLGIEFDRRRAERALRESEQRLRDMADVSSDWFWETDDRLHFIDRFGQDPSTHARWRRGPIGKTVEEITRRLMTDPGDAERHLRFYATRVPFRDERYSVVNAAGERGFFSLSGKPVFGEDGRFVGYRGTGRECTEQVRIEREVARKSELLQAMLDHFPSGVAILDADLSLIAVNEQFLELLGFPGGTAESGEIDRQLREWLDVARQSTPQKFERMRQNGTVIEFQVNALPNRGFVAICTDITPRRRAEGALRAAVDQAELANRSKTEFLANISHELRTPLNAIIGFSEIMQNELFGPLGNGNYVDYARDIHESGTHLLSVINDILDVSKAEAGKIELRDELVDIGAVIDASLRFVRDRANTERVTLQVDLAPGLPGLRADPLRLKQILLNLLSNAIKFTPEGGVVTVSARLGPDQGLLLAIQDTGIGILPQDVPRVLEPFGQAESALHRHYEGTGLGLPLAKALVELHDGILTLDSVFGSGTVVTIHFPHERLAAASMLARA